MRKSLPWRTAPLLAAIGSIILFSTARAEPSPSRCEPPIASIKSVEGRVETRTGDATSWRSVALDERLCPGDMVRVGRESRALVLLSNDTFLRLDQGTTLTLSGPARAQDSWLDILSGIVEVISRVPGAFKIKTPFVNAAIEGTEFVVAVTANEGSVTVLEGRVLAENPLGSVVLGPGEGATARAGEAPRARLIVRPRDAVQWALYYPPLLDRRLLLERDPPARQEAVAASFAAYDRGDINAALGAVRSLADKGDDHRVLTHQAALRLLLGRVDEATADIERALRLSVAGAHGTALKSVIALSQNDKDRALALAREAIAADSQSVPAWIALSYAQQGAFAIQDAAASAERALALDANDALVWARHAELQLSLGDARAARRSAQRALEINPRSPRAHIMLGFAHLAGMDALAARAEFEQATVLDSADPLARLGLGLAIIRRGDLAGGRREIETATILDPNNALIRSYLGKAYYEEKRGRLAESQFATAKELDKNDPTPYFYDAIRQQTENRPVEALRELQKSVELNDNRAVYRSRLLLDQDLAARNASLARVYSDLGFDQLALRQGWTALSVDPANYSAHRFLSDSYATLPRHEIARVSELLQAQMLQPINLTPLQPQLAESRLAILEGAGPSASSFNEYNALFVRDRVALEADGIDGSNHTYGGDLVVSGIYGPASASVGGFRYATDGFRPNNFLSHTLENAFVQVAISPALNVQAEQRSKTSRFGDLAMRFNLETFFPADSQRIETDSTRIGLRYAFTPNTNLLLSYQKQEELDQQHQERPGTPISTTADTQGRVDGDTKELQYLGKYTWGSVVLGGGRLHQDGSALTTVFPRLGAIALPPTRVVSTTNVDHDSEYLYATVSLSQNLLAVVGGSNESFKDQQIEREKFNPKLGLIWDVTPSTALRAAAFRALKRPLLTNQTLEPTSVAGFNQFFDDENATISKRTGVGVDHRFTDSLYAGLELTRRDMQAPTALNRQTTDSQEERLHRAYLYWIPLNRLVVGGEYQWDHFVQDRAFSDVGNPSDLLTQSVPLRASYFMNEKLFFTLTSTLVHQTVEFFPAAGIPGEQVSRFTLFDVTGGYRLPQRSGIVSVAVKNIFDRSFKFQDRSFQTLGSPIAPPFLPERTVYLLFSLAF